MKKFYTTLMVLTMALASSTAHAANWFVKMIGAAGQDEVLRLQAEVAAAQVAAAQSNIWIYSITALLIAMIVTPYITKGCDKVRKWRKTDNPSC
jgi:hypothetical protein